MPDDATKILCGSCGRPRPTGGRHQCRCIPPEVWELPEMRQAREKRDATTVIRLVRWNTDLSQTALSRMTGLAQSTISDIISGKTDLKHRDRIAQALDGLGGPPTPSGTSPQPAPVASATVDSFLPTRDLTSQLHLGHGRRISHTTVNSLIQRVHALRMADDVIAGNDLIAPALRELSTATTLLHTSTHTDTVGRELRTAVGELAQITGWIASDAGQHERAERIYRLGLKAAREAEDTTLAAQLAGSLAYQLTNTGAEDRGLELARAAVEEAGPTAPARARALYWDRLAWAHAKRGDSRSAVRALAQASEALSQHEPGRAEPEWLYWVDEGELQIMEARVHTELRRPLRAVPLLEQVLARYDSTHGREMALYLSWLAVAYADANEPEEAARVAGRMMAHARGLGSDRTTERERVVRSVLQRFREVPEVRDVLEQT